MDTKFLKNKKFLKKHSDENFILTERDKFDKVVFKIFFVIFLLHSLTLILTALWMFISSLKDYNLYITPGKSFALPTKWMWSNYVDAFTSLKVNTSHGKVGIFGMVFNSLWYTAISTCAGVFVPAITGYVFSKYNFKAKKFMFTVVITAMMIPIVGATASYMKIVHYLRIYDTPLFIIVTSLNGFGGSFLVYYGFFKSVSWSYAEAVMIDGGGPYTIFFKVMLPQASPIMLTYAIIGAIGNWNEYSTMLLYLPNYPTLASGLFTYKELFKSSGGNFPVYYAGLIIAMIPTLILFATCSNRIMTSISVGGLKG